MTCLCVSLDASLLVSGSDDCSVKIWDVQGRQCVRTIPHKGAELRSLTGSQGPKHVAKMGTKLCWTFVDPMSFVCCALLLFCGLLQSNIVRFAMWSVVWKRFSCFLCCSPLKAAQFTLSKL